MHGRMPRVELWFYMRKLGVVEDVRVVQDLYKDRVYNDRLYNELGHAANG